MGHQRSTQPPKRYQEHRQSHRAPGERSASAHIVSLRHPTATAGQVQATLASQHKIHTSSRAGGIRVSLHAYNSSDNIRALTQALATITPH
jgi:selenocysteine lyase/cysteine desulfurase